MQGSATSEPSGGKCAPQPVAARMAQRLRDSEILAADRLAQGCEQRGQDLPTWRPRPVDGLDGLTRKK